MTAVARHSGLLAVLGEAQRIGALGAAPLESIIGHAEAFADALPESTSTCIDLGTGAGVPGLVIAVARPMMRLTLVDRRAKRTDALERAIRVLEMRDRVSVFGPPDLTLLTAAACVRSGGVVVISEPPEDHAPRWSPDLLQQAGISHWERRGPVAVFHVEHS
jgi:16S rRNA (guanine527-N7)-methyltransferase